MAECVFSVILNLSLMIQTLNTIATQTVNQDNTTKTVKHATLVVELAIVQMNTIVTLASLTSMSYIGLVIDASKNVEMARCWECMNATMET